MMIFAIARICDWLINFVVAVISRHFGHTVYAVVCESFVQVCLYFTAISEVSDVILCHSPSCKLSFNLSFFLAGYP